jgi:hypothetical protein
LEAFPWDSAPHYLLRDRDGSYGEKFHETASWLGICEVLTAPQSPWQNAYAERLMGRIVEIPQVGGLHHPYERIAA